MQVEIETGVNYFVGLLIEYGEGLTQQNLEQFKNSLINILSSRYINHWYPQYPHRGEAYRCLTVNTNLDPTLFRACQEANIEPELLKCCLPKKLFLWIDPGHVSCRVGNERCPIRDLYRCYTKEYQQQLHHEEKRYNYYQHPSSNSSLSLSINNNNKENKENHYKILTLSSNKKSYAAAVEGIENSNVPSVLSITTRNSNNNNNPIIIQSESNYPVTSSIRLTAENNFHSYSSMKNNHLKYKTSTRLNLPIPITMSSVGNINFYRQQQHQHQQTHIQQSFAIKQPIRTIQQSYHQDQFLVDHENNYCMQDDNLNKLFMKNISYILPNPQYQPHHQLSTYMFHPHPSTMHLTRTSLHQQVSNNTGCYSTIPTNTQFMRNIHPYYPNTSLTNKSPSTITWSDHTRSFLSSTAHTSPSFPSYPISFQQQQQQQRQIYCRHQTAW
ncbi:unnamed protein product [Didymodactylos carnosus]|uniref:Anti-proliferative protein domain-containing protein n=1 Tax=Didymodactylos carnosus TaxID=1234261 RepID=A0A814G1X6_9BILA|nr:unnamed protein product [Didymodactylos carnosus]CAF3762588.1 unnamed protein product [Didymodactylos carnosus]